MVKFSFRLVSITILLFALVACASKRSDLYAVNSSPYGWGARDDLKISDVQTAIKHSADKTGWALTDKSVGKYAAKKEWGRGKHNAVVTIVYTPKIFSISYTDSKNLNYTGTSIHSAYSRFVMELEAQIRTEVAKIGGGGGAGSGGPAPKCKDVGGYQTYLRKTGRTCVL